MKSSQAGALMDPLPPPARSLQLAELFEPPPKCAHPQSGEQQPGKGAPRQIPGFDDPPPFLFAVDPSISSSICQETGGPSKALGARPRRTRADSMSRSRGSEAQGAAVQGPGGGVQVPGALGARPALREEREERALHHLAREQGHGNFCQLLSCQLKGSNSWFWQAQRQTEEAHGPKSSGSSPPN